MNGSPDYVPQVGDVVEFEYCGVTCKGIQGLGDAVAARYGENGRHGMGGFTPSMTENLRFTGQRIEGLKDFDEVDAAANNVGKTHFSSFTPDPDKSYTENQAAWVKFHGLEVGNIAKVVRKVTDNMTWNSDGDMDITIGMSGRVSYIGSGCVHVTFNDDITWAYQYECLEPVK